MQRNINYNDFERFKDKCGIVYCSTQRDTKDMAYLLKAKGISAVHYDSALGDMEKEHSSHAWLDGRTSIICAIKAFVMGIDKKGCAICNPYFHS